MDEARHQAERREHRRYKIRDHLLVTNTSKNGPAIDISQGGVAFSCMTPQERSDETIKFGTLVGSDFCLSRVPLEMTSSCPAQAEGRKVLSRYGLKFLDLSEEQKARLARIIETLK